MAISINRLNDNGPSDIQLVDENGNVITDVNVNENAADGTFIADVLVTDPDGNSDHTITLVNDGGGAFALGSIRVGNGNLLDYESASTRQVTVRATDSNGLSFDKTFTIALNDIFDTPTVPVNNPVVTLSESSTSTTGTGDFSPGTTSTAQHVRDSILAQKTSSATGIDSNTTQTDIENADALAVLLNPNADPTQVFDAPGAGGDPDAVSEDGSGTGEAAGDDPVEATAEGEFTQEAEGRTPLSRDIKKQSEQFEIQRKEILDMFENFGNKLGCSA